MMNTQHPIFIYKKEEETNIKVLKHIEQQLSVCRFEIMSKTKKSVLMHALSVEIDG